MTPTTFSGFADALLADGPDERYAARMSRIGRLVGSWDARGRRLDEESGEWVERSFTWIVSYVLGGRAVQDLEVVPSATRPDEPVTIATALRVYDPVAGITRVSYVSPESNQYCNLVAIGWRDGIRQDGTQNDGRPIRWNFSAITDDSYVWDGWVSNDDGATWELVEHIEGTRIA
jgi:hypothetical protein